MIDYQLEVPHRIATTRVSGRLRFADLANHLHRLLRDRDFRVDFDAVIVAEDLAAVLSPSAVASFAPLVRAWSSRRKGARWAFVLPTPETKRFAEQALNEIGVHDIVARCFLTELAARDWLFAEQTLRAVGAAALDHPSSASR